jgi:hypothetical protein
MTNHTLENYFSGCIDPSLHLILAVFGAIQFVGFFASPLDVQSVVQFS